MSQYGFQFELPLRRNGFFFMTEETFSQYMEGTITGPYPKTNLRAGELFRQYIKQPEVSIIHFRNSLGEMVKIVLR